MASILADAIVGKLCDMAIEKMADEVSVVWNFPEDFEWLKKRFMEINYVLKEADEESSRQKEPVAKWLHRVRDIAWEAEDILEERAVDSMYAALEELAVDSMNATNICHHLFLCNLWEQFILRLHMGGRIRKLKDRLNCVVKEAKQLKEFRDLVGQKAIKAESSTTSKKSGSFPPMDSNPVGMESKIERMENLLKNPDISKIAVVGMGGLGKTYLLQNLYNAEKERYEISAWLSVSQSYSVSQLQRNLAFQLSKEFSKEIMQCGVSEEVVGDSIHSFLKGKRYLIVLDDIWTAAREVDLIAKLGLPIRDNGESKILVSTRSREVCRDLNAHIYEIEYLTDEESWSLFCDHAFPTSEENKVPGQLEEVAHNILRQCGKLPLAVKTTAASLKSTTQLTEWQSKLSKLTNLGTSNDPVMDILKLSYYSLPAHLKACFAYLSFFPEDEQIECEYLVYLWTAEGLIPAGDNPWHCLDQLANLCLLEVWEGISEGEFSLHDPKKYCKIHDLLLDLAKLVSRENKCAFGIEEAFSNSHSVNSGGWCRLFLAKKDIDDHAISEGHLVSPTVARTLSLSRNIQIGKSIPTMLFSGMRVLRVLDLSFTNISTLPASVGEMKLLKVLNLRETNIRELPECVRCLKSLSFLNFLSKWIVEVPKWISELKCLQHLEGCFKQLPREISKLQSLRTLRGSELCLSNIKEDGALRLEDVGKMSEMEEIGFEVDNEWQLRKMKQGILAPLKKMRRLTVMNHILLMIIDPPQFPVRMSTMRNLEHLTLYSFVVPSWIFCLTNLKYLCLRGFHFNDFPELHDLPNLVSVHLYHNRGCREFPKAFGKSGGFPHLSFLFICGFDDLEKFPEIEDGAMTCLEKFELTYCEKLKKVGKGLERLKRFKEFNFQGSGTDELRETLKEGGIYWKKIKAANPYITICG